MIVIASPSLPLFERAGEGFDLVMGNRFKGGIKPGAINRSISTWAILCESTVAGVCIVLVWRLSLRTSRIFWQGSLPQDGSADDRDGIRQRNDDEGSPFQDADHRGADRIFIAGRAQPSTAFEYLARWMRRHLAHAVLEPALSYSSTPCAAVLSAGLLVMLWLLPGPKKVGSVNFDVHTHLLLHGGIQYS